MSALPASLAAKPNIPHRNQTDAQIAEECAYWQAKIDAATGWGAGYGFALSQRDACAREMRRRQERGGVQ